MTGEVIDRPKGDVAELWKAYAKALERERLTQLALRKAQKQRDP